MNPDQCKALGWILVAGSLGYHFGGWIGFLVLGIVLLLIGVRNTEDK